MEIAETYGPLDLDGPILTKAKIFIQNFWQLNLEWNENLLSDSLQEWKQFLLSLTELNDSVISRYIFEDKPDKIELHGFSDVSGKVYGAAICLRSLTKNGKFSSQFMCSK